MNIYDLVLNSTLYLVFIFCLNDSSVIELEFLFKFNNPEYNFLDYVERLVNLVLILSILFHFSSFTDLVELNKYQLFYVGIPCLKLSQY